MKGKFGITVLLLSSLTFAAPVSAPDPQLSDTPIISGGGTVGSLSCQAFQGDGIGVRLFGGETLVFYGGGSGGSAAGGYLSTKTTYDGIGFVRIVGRDGYCYCVSYYEGRCVEVSCLSGSGIGLFASRSDTSWNSFIAGAGAGFGNRHGGGWYGEGGGNIYRGTWFREEGFSRPIYNCYRECRRVLFGRICRDVCRITGFIYVSRGGVGFHGGNNDVGSGGGASSISAYYGTSLRGFTNPGTTLTVLGGGNYGAGRPTLYVCQ
jgi:hypothetical protein